MADDPFPFQLLDVVDGALGDRLFQVGGLIDAVDKAKIDVVCFQLLELPVDRALDLLEVERPAVSAAAVVGAKVDLESGLSRGDYPNYIFFECVNYPLSICSDGRQ